MAIYGVLCASRHAFRFTALASGLLLALLVIMFVGAHFGFAHVPGFDGPRLMPDGTGARNEFDKFAHFFQGLVPAIAIRELLIRFRVLSAPRWLSVVVLGLTLALSALYELFEWLSYLALQSRAEDFIGAQHDPWDAQSDMAMALLGAFAALALLSRCHDTSLEEFRPRQRTAVSRP